MEAMADKIPSPQELKAQAIALLVLGYSSRYVANELRMKYGLMRPPHYTTIARWLRQAQLGLKGNRAAKARWAAIVNRAGVMMMDRLDETERLSAVGVAKMYGTAMDVYLALERSMSRQ